MSFGTATCGRQKFNIVFVDGKGWRFPQVVGDRIVFDKNGRVATTTSETLSVVEFANVVQWPQQKILERVHTGKIKADKDRGSYRIPRNELNGYLHGREYLQALADGRSVADSL